MDMDAKIVANLWNINPTWQRKLLCFRDVDKSHIPKLLDLHIPRYSFHYSPMSARLIKEVRELKIELLEKRRHSHGVCPVEFRTDARTQPNDRCLFCGRWKICRDCQDKREREELAKALDSCLWYLDLHTAIPRFVTPRVWTHPFVRPSKTHGAVRNVDENKANKLKAKLTTIGVQYDPVPKPRSLIIRYPDPFHGSPVGHRLNPPCFPAGDTYSPLAVGAVPMISTDSTHSSDIHNPAIVATSDGTIPAAESTTSTDSTDSNNIQKPAIVTSEGGTIPTATATSTSQANIIVSYKPEIYEVLTNNSEDHTTISLQNFVTQMIQEQVQEQVCEIGAELKCVKNELNCVKNEIHMLREKVGHMEQEMRHMEKELKQTSELAILCIDKMTVLSEENQNLRKVLTRIGTTLDRVLDLDDDINMRCFLDSYLRKHGFQGRGRKEFIDNLFRKDPVCKAMYDRLFQRSRPNIHTAAYERPWALVASSLLRSSPCQAVPTTKTKLNDAEWVEIERMWKELCGTKWDMEVHAPCYRTHL